MRNLLFALLCLGLAVGVLAAGYYTGVEVLHICLGATFGGGCLVVGYFFGAQHKLALLIFILLLGTFGYWTSVFASSFFVRADSLTTLEWWYSIALGVALTGSAHGGICLRQWRTQQQEFCIVKL